MAKSESALGVALRTVARRNKDATIRVCDDCGVPLIWTMAFAYKERYCLNCGFSGGMMGTGEDVPATRELIFQKKLVDAIWKVIYGKKGFIPRSSQRTNCKKCDSTREYHSNHLTRAEKEWDTIARNYIKVFREARLLDSHKRK